MKITPRAALTIQSLLRNREGSGLRIYPVPSEDDGRLEMALAVETAPHPGDEVVAEHGSRVFVEQRLVPPLADKTLDVSRPDGEKGVRFRIIR